MTTAAHLGYKVGDQFIYNNKEAGSIDWFFNGSTITLKSGIDSETPAFDGPAKENGVGGRKCKTGDDIHGYAKVACITPVKSPEEVSAPAFGVYVHSGATTFTIDRELSGSEIAAILAVVGL